MTEMYPSVPWQVDFPVCTSMLAQFALPTLLDGLYVVDAL